MSNAADLVIKCEDHLKDNRHLYAHKARRKKIALIGVEVTNGHSAQVTMALGASKLVAGGQNHCVETPSVIIRKFSEFTWDFIVFAILEFNPVLVAVDIFFLLTGPLYNRRLRKQLRLLTNAELVLKPGERTKAILGFRRVSKPGTQLQLWYRCGEGEEQEIECDIY